MKRQIERILRAEEGEVVKLIPDLILINNGNTRRVRNFINGAKSPEKVFVYYDHNVPAGSTEDAKVFDELLAMSKEYDFNFRQAKGIGILDLIDRGEIEEGDIVITGSRQAGIVGSIGALGINLSNTEIGRVIENDAYSTIVPETIGIRVKGRLREGADMIDAGMYFNNMNLAIMGKSVEFIGGDLTKREKEILCAMAGNEGCYAAFYVDEGEASYDLDLSQVVPMTMLPCNSLSDQLKAEYVKRSDLDEVEFDAGQIGGIVGGRIEELRRAGEFLKNEELKLGFRLSIAPATSKDYIDALDEGLISQFIDFGTQIIAAGDHSEVSQGAGAMGPDEKLITTGQYTYKGSMGSDKASVYSASVESVLKEAIK